jgi:hypothetical protein
MLFLGGQAHAAGGVVEMLDAEIDVGGLRGLLALLGEAGRLPGVYG